MELARIEDRIWADIRHCFGVSTAFHLTWPEIKSMKRACGYQLNGHESRIADEWDARHGAPALNRPPAYRLAGD